MNIKIDEIMEQVHKLRHFCTSEKQSVNEEKILREMIEKALNEKENMTTIENLQLQETSGASPEDHLSNRLKVPDGYALIKQEPDAELLHRLCDLVDNIVDHDVLTESGALAVYKFISGYEPKYTHKAESDPLNMPLPCDVTIGLSMIKKGVALRLLVNRAKLIHEMLTEEIQNKLSKHNQD